MTRDQKLQLITSVTHLFWFKDKIDPIKDKEVYNDFVNTIYKIENIIKNLETN